VPLTARQCIELFHLVFLRALSAKGEDKARIALKGGCNLRFYFGSPRYSEDIDFDVGVIAKNTLKNKVERLLKAPVVLSPLRSNGIDIEDYTAPKQTDTTQRWKVGLRSGGLHFPLRTKVEFSRRDALEGTAFESIERELLRTYGLTPSLAAHYTSRAAIAQKVQALAGRAEPQARDVFDLNLLFSRPDSRAVALGTAERRHVGAALDNAMAISFDEYRSKVVAYLEPAQASPYGGRAAWDAMQGAVVDQLEALR
jgi:predicted nucleotidyltransferase component of viral defense system